MLQTISFLKNIISLSEIKSKVNANRSLQSHSIQAVGNKPELSEKSLIVVATAFCLCPYYRQDAKPLSDSLRLTNVQGVESIILRIENASTFEETSLLIQEAARICGERGVSIDFNEIAEMLKTYE